MKSLLQRLIDAEQNVHGAFELDEDTMCELVDLLSQPPVAWTSQRSLDVRCKITAFTDEDSAKEHGDKSARNDIVPLYKLG